MSQKKNDTDVALCNFNSHQPILVISGRNVAEREHYQTVVFFISPLLTNVSALPGETLTPEMVFLVPCLENGDASLAILLTFN